MQQLPIVYHEDYVVPLPEGHRFPMAKFKLLYERVCELIPLQQLQVHRPEFPKIEYLERVHDPNFIQDYIHGTLEFQAQRRIGLPWSDGLVTRTITAVGGTLLTTRLAIEKGIALNTAGGTHHAFPNYGSGFCIFNDFAIAIRQLQHEGEIQNVLIIDLDVHQGDGTAHIFSSDPNVFTCSLHCEKNFPNHKKQSDLDVPLPENIGDREYLQVLDDTLEKLFSQFSPDLVCYNAGTDPHKDDVLGKLQLTDKGIYQRDSTVLKACREKNIPIACVIGGGYGKDMKALIERHTFLFQAAHQIYVEEATPKVDSIQLTQACN